MTAINANYSDFNTVSLIDENKHLPGIPTQFATHEKTHAIGMGYLKGICITTAIAFALAATGAVIAATVGIVWIGALCVGIGAATVIGFVCIYAAVKAAKFLLTAKKIEKQQFGHLDTELYHDVNSLRAGDLVKGNRAFVTENAAESLENKLKIIKSAKQSIEISANYLGGNCCNLLLQSLIERLETRKGLQVHILVTPDFLGDEDLKNLEWMQEKYPDRFHLVITPVKVDLTPCFRFHENHVKVVIVDEKYFVFGGSSIQDFLSTQGNAEAPFAPDANFLQKNILASSARDHDVVGCGPIASVMRKEFFKLYGIWECKTDIKSEKPASHYYPLTVEIPKENEVLDEKVLKSDVSMRFLMSYPEETGSNPITKAYSDIIKVADEVIIGNMYFDPHKQIAEQLYKKKVTLVTNGYTEGMSPLENIAFIWGGRYYHYPKLHADVYEFNIKNGLYHAKVIAAKGAHSVAGIGSYNFGWRSHANDHEAFMLLYGYEITRNMEDIINTDIALSKKVPEEEIKKYGTNISSKTLGRINRYCTSIFV
ncbi:MAG: phosphatidylserine/phosphatidylglycerophosphate/cardiolipin synthase family protein [Chlamydiia bacterium]|nr:phosphatidylserine/phosphatidylglycerophosphate/cardiolipin synthase family protein [Chlamydiia bacterium]